MASGLELTSPLKEYINIRMGGVDKFLGKVGEGTDVRTQVEVARTTKHHRKGNVFYAEATLQVLGENIRAENDGEEIRAVIDGLRDKLAEEVKKFKEKKEEK